jgi:hypothetical protein
MILDAFEERKEDILNIISGLSFLFVINILTDVKEDFTPNQFTLFVRDNDIVRNFTYIIIIFITIQFFNFKISESSVMSRVYSTFIIYFFIILFSKQTLYFSILEFLIFLGLYGIYYYISEIESNNDFNDDKFDDFFLSIYILLGSLFLISFVGAYIYYKKQIKDKKGRFSYYKFFLGKKESSYTKIKN